MHNKYIIHICGLLKLFGHLYIQGDVSGANGTDIDTNKMLFPVYRLYMVPLGAINRPVIGICLIYSNNSIYWTSNHILDLLM